jgi:hypothetical protein
MKKIEVFDPALCCSSGVCGVDTDQALVVFAADVDWVRQRGGTIERFNLAQQPMVFAENRTIKGFLERSGSGALPTFSCLHWQGRGRQDVTRLRDSSTPSKRGQASPARKH